jgi:hypothetical protein
MNGLKLEVGLMGKSLGLDNREMWDGGPNWHSPQVQQARIKKPPKGAASNV